MDPLTVSKYLMAIRSLRVDFIKDTKKTPVIEHEGKRFFDPAYVAWLEKKILLKGNAGR